MNKEKLEAISESLINYATRSNDILALIENIPEESGLSKAGMEYEMRMLKILSVGWGLAFLLDNHPDKTALSEKFWQKVFILSKEIDDLCREAGNQLDYFANLRNRLDIYVSSLKGLKETEDFALKIGLCYAELCGDSQDAYALLAGKGIFTGVLASLEAYIKEELKQ